MTFLKLTVTLAAAKRLLLEVENGTDIHLARYLPFPAPFEAYFQEAENNEGSLSRA